MRRRRQHTRRPGFDPRMLGSALKIWLDVSQSTSDVNGVSSVPDRMGGAAAVQSVNAQKPTLGTTSNGISKLTCTDDVLLLPLSAPLLNDTNFGIAMWVKPANITTSSDIFGVVTGTSAASLNRINIRQTTDDLVVFLWATAANIRSGRSLAVNALLQPNVWVFMTYEFTGAGADELAKSKFKYNGTPLAERNAMEYADAQNVVGPPGPSTLITGMTGNALLFARTNVGGNPFQGDATDVFVYDPTLMTADALVQLAQYEVPVG